MTNAARRFEGFTLLVLGLALCSLVWWGWLAAMPMISDAGDYLLQAREIEARWPALWPEKAWYWPPGTSWVLAFFGAPFGVDTGSARLTTIAASALTMVGVRSLAACLTSDRNVVNLAGVIALLYPPAVLMSGQSYAQVFAHLWLVLLAMVLLRGWQARSAWVFFLAGLVFGLGCLTRPSMLSLWAALGGLFVLSLARGWAREARWTARGLALAAAALAGGFLLVVAPVLHGNAVRGGGYTISTNNERNFFLGNNRYTPLYKTSHLAQRPLESLEPEVRDYLKAIYALPDRRQAMLREALDYMASHPGETAWRTLSRVRAFWGFDYVMSREIAKANALGKALALALLAVEAGGYVALMIAALVGAFHGSTWLAPRAGVLLALVAAYQLPYAFAFAGGTYHFPVIGLLVPFAAAGGRFLAAPNALRAISPWAWLAIVIFGLVQLEYAWEVARLAWAD